MSEAKPHEEPLEPAARARPAGDRPTLLGGLMDSLRQLGRDVVSIAVGKPGPDEPPATQPQQPPPADAPSETRIRVLHEVAERLRGAADSYIAAKMDEIEARVDAKLDHIEQRIDRKIVELHEQLRELRDQEIRHRLRLLKLTLVFTVLVAVLSLGYKWLVHRIG